MAVIALLVLTLLVLTPVRAQTVKPEVVTPVSLSNTDTNRVVCVNGMMNDVFFSNDKIIEVPLAGKNGFVKFPILKKGEVMTYVTKRAEFHFICDGQTYTLLGTPEALPAQVIYLGDDQHKQVKANIALMGDMPQERQGIFLAVSALTDDLPAQFRVNKVDALAWQRTLIKDADIALVRTIKVDGMGLRLKEYLLKSYREQYLDERRFVKKALSSSILQVTVSPLSVGPGQMARVFIVERAVN